MSKTEGGDKLPFDDEMGKNQKAIKVLQRLFDAGYGTEKRLSIWRWMKCLLCRE